VKGLAGTAFANYSRIYDEDDPGAQQVEVGGGVA
jgi:hypothetical protein